MWFVQLLRFLAMSLARAVGRVAAVMPKAVVPAPQRAISTSTIARGGHAEMFTPEKYNPLGAPRKYRSLHMKDAL